MITAIFAAVTVASCGSPPSQPCDCVGVYLAPDARGSHVESVETHGCARAVEDHGQGSHVSGVVGSDGRSITLAGPLSFTVCPVGATCPILFTESFAVTPHGSLCRVPKGRPGWMSLCVEHNPPTEWGRLVWKRTSTKPITVRGRGNIVEGNITVEPCGPDTWTRVISDKDGNVLVRCEAPKRRKGHRP